LAFAVEPFDAGDGEKNAMHDAQIRVDKLPSGKHKIVVDGVSWIGRREWETSYPQWLIDAVLAFKGPAFLCDEIAREESPDYTAAALRQAMFAYIAEDAFDGARILDFGCGAGASTVSLGRSFPKAEIVGVELQERAIEVARGRCRFYGLENVAFFPSPSDNELPADIGEFDYIVLSGVFEHLLPDERPVLMPTLWNALKPGGILFIHETPNRRFPLETHTTWLPLINYMPAPCAHFMVKRFGHGKARLLDWNTQLRRGIRGGSIGEIRGLLPGATLLRPSRCGIDNLTDLWYATAPKNRYPRAKRYVRALARSLAAIGIECPPYLELALQKPR
jgi:2-polyprenyl-3-methyl-5-hydroxy-6-metoxy-1,4-benzoquinol methylase